MKANESNYSKIVKEIRIMIAEEMMFLGLKLMPENSEERSLFEMMLLSYLKIRGKKILGRLRENQRAKT